MQLEKDKITYFLLFFFSLSYFIFGFIVGENSAGAGGYKGDFIHTWNNLKIFLNNNINYSIQEYYSNRSPLIYILHEYFNPLTHNEFQFRLSVFLLSFFIPVLLFLCLKSKFQKENINILVLLTMCSTVLFSPYVRTSGYWALEENFGIIAVLLSYLFFNYFNISSINKFILLFFAIFFSSICVYFDLKLIIIPLIIFCSIIFSECERKFKIVSVSLYFLFSLPYFYLIYNWKGFFSPKAAITHTLKEGIYWDHLVYVIPIICLYMMPFFILRKKNLIDEIKINIFKNSTNLILVILIFLSLFFIIFFYKPVELSYHANIGKGFIFKLGSLFNNILYKKLFFLISSFTSTIIVITYIGKKITDRLIIFFYILLSVLLYPLMQEYFDPLIFLLVLLFFKTKIFLNNNKSIYLFYFYFLSLGLFAKFYYQSILNL